MITTILLIVALIAFLIATLPAPTGTPALYNPFRRINMTALGLFLCLLAYLLVHYTAIR